MMSVVEQPLLGMMAVIESRLRNLFVQILWRSFDVGVYDLRPLGVLIYLCVELYVQLPSIPVMVAGHHLSVPR